MFDSRPNRFLAVALLASIVAVIFVFGGKEDAAAAVGIIFSAYMFGEGCGWLVSSADSL